MVKIVVFMASLTAVTCLAEPLTNATLLIGMSLTTNEIVRLPICDSTSPDTVFLGTVRALREGNLRNLYYHFETNYLFSLTGYHIHSNVPEETASSFHAVMSDAHLSNLVIVAYSVLSSNQFVRISASLQENYVNRTLSEPIALTLSQNQTGWKIISYDDDKWDD